MSVWIEKAFESGKTTPTKPKGMKPPTTPTAAAKPTMPTAPKKIAQPGKPGSLKPVNSAAQPARPAAQAMNQFNTLLKPSGYMLGASAPAPAAGAAAKPAKPKQPVAKRNVMSTSAWGVPSGEPVSKAKKDRRGAGAAALGAADPSGVLSGIHGAVYGKPGKKAAAGLSQGGKTLAGGVGTGVASGALTAAVTRNPRAASQAASVGGVFGGAAGAHRGFKTNKRKGRLKPAGR